MIPFEEEKVAEMVPEKSYVQVREESKGEQDKMMSEAIDIVQSSLSVSQELLKFNVDDSFTSLFRRILVDPQGAFFKIHEDIDDTLRDVVVSSIKLSLKESKLVNKLFLQIEDDFTLHFYINLKKDTEKNRSAIYDKLDEYEELSLSNRFTVQFHFLKESLIDKLDTSTATLF